MLRTFHPQEHIQNLLAKPAVVMFDDLGQQINGVTGVPGAAGLTTGGTRIGLDKIVMTAGSAFPLHVHDGDHLLYVLAGSGGIHVDGVDYELHAGDTIYVPADYPHGVLGPESGPPLCILAFGVPHHPIDSTTRMRLVAPPDLATDPTTRSGGHV
jgi:quercetin dioxygenase-like cupin family protein